MLGSVATLHCYHYSSGQSKPTAFGLSQFVHPFWKIFVMFLMSDLAFLVHLDLATLPLTSSHSFWSVVVEVHWDKKITGNHCLEQGSPTFMYLRATACVPINAKGYYFDTHFWNRNLVQFTFNYVIINDVNLCDNTHHLNAISQQACGWPTWSLRVTWCLWALCCWPLA